jgi:hypothetical protein
VPREVSETNLLLTDYWQQFSVWGASTITVIVHGQPALVRLSATQPPDPPRWADPVRFAPGEYSRARPFGYVAFKNAIAGQQAVVDFWAYAQ